MTITSYGYDGTVGESAWATMSGALGADYSILGMDDLRASIVANADRTISLTKGSAFGQGVLAVSDAATTLQFDPVSSGSRWDCAVLRRDWPNNTSTLAKVTGAGAAQLLPSGLQSSPGAGQDDQPLWLVQLTAGQSAPTGLVDLRTWPSKVIGAATLQAVKNPIPGMEVVVGGVRYRRGVDPSSGSPAWLPYTVPPSFQTTGSSSVSGFPGPTASLPSVSPLIVKTGRAHFFTFTNFGNEYGPTIVFDVPFPNALLSVSVTQMFIDADTAPAPFALDGEFSRAQFRVMYPGQGGTTKRGFFWTAFGY